MSEEILKALMELFALIAKQGDGASLLERNFVEEFLKKQLNQNLVGVYLEQYDAFIKPKKSDKPAKKKRISMLDSVKTLRVCKKINSTLVYKQKVIVLVRLYELLKSTDAITEEKLELVTTVADTFKIKKHLNLKIKAFALQKIEENTTYEGLIFYANQESQALDKYKGSQINFTTAFSGELTVLMAQEDLFFLNFMGQANDVFLNGLPLKPNSIYVFSSGSNLRFAKGDTLYYSDIVSSILEKKNPFHISFQAKGLYYKFKTGDVGLRGVSIHENEGNLVGIMGASGAGKTTLLNALMGSYKLNDGTIKINGIDIHQKKKEALEGVIGYVPQDDLLIEDLSVYQNLYYSTKLCFSHFSEQEIEQTVLKVLSSLGLLEIKDLKVGSPLNKTISGGQRKRLNIALELVREPAIMFLDEPTSGLSSRDSENVIDLLRELALKGKLIFVVIHQPSSDIYKMFDKICILDVGGYQIYYGDPVDAVSYFKKLDHQVDSDVSECPTCGNVNPEVIFNIIESKVVDEYGNLTEKRKVSPKQWSDYFQQHMMLRPVKSFSDRFPKLLHLPKKIKQFEIFTKRDFLSKVSNLQYVFINLLEAPLLAFFLSFIIRYIRDPYQSSGYIFRENDNIPSYIFVGIVVSLFIGLTVSAEEIFRDRKILKRERFLNLSRHSYLFSKLAILFTLSAVQALLFVLIGNSILSIKSMYVSYWLIFFSIFCVSNLIGLNISSSFNSAVTIYILIPILIIPQMILGGAMFSYEKLNEFIGGGYDVPLAAQFMPSRWAYEALMVNQFKNNPWGEVFYKVDQKIAQADYKSNYLIPELNKKLSFAQKYAQSKNDSILEIVQNNILKSQHFIENEALIDTAVVISSIFEDQQSKKISQLKVQLSVIDAHYKKQYKLFSKQREGFIVQSTSDAQKKQEFRNFRDQFYNESVHDIVKKVDARFPYLDQKRKVQKITDPIYSEYASSNLNVRYPLFTSYKSFFGLQIDTFWYNLIVLWVMICILYILLYYEILYKALNLRFFTTRH